MKSLPLLLLVAIIGLSTSLPTLPLAATGRLEYFDRLKAEIPPGLTEMLRVPGVGPKTGKLFDRLLDRGEGARVVDVLFHLPHSTIDRRNRPKLRDAPRDQIVTIEVTVVEHRAPSGKYAKTPYKVLVEDATLQR